MLISHRYLFFAVLLLLKQQLVDIGGPALVFQLRDILLYKYCFYVFLLWETLLELELEALKNMISGHWCFRCSSFSCVNMFLLCNMHPCHFTACSKQAKQGRQWHVYPCGIVYFSISTPLGVEKNCFNVHDLLLPH